MREAIEVSEFNFYASDPIDDKSLSEADTSAKFIDPMLKKRDGKKIKSN